MSFVCRLCTKPYTGPGTSHSIYVTTCGHLIGQSCFKEILNKVKQPMDFKCHECFRTVREIDYHPLYDIPDEFFNITSKSYQIKRDLNDDYVKRQCLMGNFENELLILKKWSSTFVGCLEMYDSFNGYLIIVGYSGVVNKNTQFMSIFDTNNGIDKYRNDGVLEFCIGYENGDLKMMNGRWEGVKFDVVCRTNFHRIEKIHSICYVKKNKLVYSTGKGNLSFLDSAVRSSNNNRHIWCDNDSIKRSIITDIQKLTDDIVLGLVNGSLYLFSKNQESYEIFKDNSNKIIKYTVDPVTKMLFLFCCKNYKLRRSNRTPHSYISCAIHDGPPSDSDVEEEHMYHTSILEVFSCDKGKFSTHFKPDLFFMMEKEKPILYSLLPNPETKIIQGCRIPFFETCLGKETFEGLNDCIGTICIDEPQLFLPKIIKRKIAILFKNRFDIVDLYCSIADG